MLAEQFEAKLSTILAGAGTLAATIELNYATAGKPHQIGTYVIFGTLSLALYTAAVIALVRTRASRGLHITNLKDSEIICPEDIARGMSVHDSEGLRIIVSHAKLESRTEL